MTHWCSGSKYVPSYDGDTSYALLNASFLKAADWFLYNVFSYHVPSNKNRTLIGNKNVDHSDVFGVGTAPTTSSFSTELPTPEYIAHRQLNDETRDI